MAVRVHQNGLVASSGVHPHYAGAPFITRKQVYWVQSTHARASDTNPGTEPEEPHATIDHAMSTASAGDIVVALETHAEVGSVVVAKALELIGVGGTGTRPTIRGVLTHSLSITAAGVTVRNFKVTQPFNGESTTNAYCVHVEAAGVVLGQLYCEDGRTGDTLDAHITDACILELASGASQVWIDGCSLKWTATDTEAASATVNGMIAGIHVTSTATVATCWIDQTIFDGGSMGFDKGALYVESGGSIANGRLWRNTFGAGCDVLAEGSAAFRGYGSGNTWVNGDQRISVDNVRWYTNGLIDAEEGVHEYLSDPYFFHVGGTVYYVDSENENASNSNAGTKRTRPWATLVKAAAIGNSGDFIIVEKSHRETVTTDLQWTKDYVRVFGLGSGDDRALVTPDITLGGGGVPSVTHVWDLAANGCEVHNVRFAAADETHTSVVNTGSYHSSVIESCGFDQGANDDTAIIVAILATFTLIKGNTFTLSANGASRAIYMLSTGTKPSWLTDNEFDGGAYDWNNGGIDATSTTLGYFMLYRNTLRAGADVYIPDSTHVGWNISGTIAAAGSQQRVIG